MGENINTDIKQYLTFMMEHEQYAIPVTDIREVLLVPKITRIPRMPSFMRGVINLRGSVVPILDLKMKFGMGETASSVDTAIIVVEIPYDNESEEQECIHLGIFADAVKKVVAIGSGEIEPPPRIGTRIQTSFIEGIGHINDDFIVILNMKEILTTEDLELMESAKESEVTT